MEQKVNKSRELLRFLKFTLLSISAGLIELGSFSIMKELIRMSYWPSYLIALILSIVWNFTLNRKLTFQSANNIPVAMVKLFGFYAIFTPLSTWGGHVLTEGGLNEYLVLAGTMVVNFITEYIFMKYIVFGDSIDSASRSE